MNFGKSGIKLLLSKTMSCPLQSSRRERGHDYTIAVYQTGKSIPMNINIMHWNKTCMYICIIHEYTAEANLIQHIHMFIIILKQIQLQKLNKQRILLWKISCPVTRYAATTFHPTIGQCAHQSLSTTATPELSMITTRN